MIFYEMHLSEAGMKKLALLTLCIALMACGESKECQQAKNAEHIYKSGLWELESAHSSVSRKLESGGPSGNELHDLQREQSSLDKRIKSMKNRIESARKKKAKECG